MMGELIVRNLLHRPLRTLIGVMAVYARHKFSPSALDAMAVVAFSFAIATREDVGLHAFGFLSVWAGLNWLQGVPSRQSRWNLTRGCSARPPAGRWFGSRSCSVFARDGCNASSPARLQKASSTTLRSRFSSRLARAESNHFLACGSARARYLSRLPGANAAITA